MTDASYTLSMFQIEQTYLDENLPLEMIEQVAFYKRDYEIVDTICCEIKIGTDRSTYDENMAGWDLLIAHLENLPGFWALWALEVIQPAFELCWFVACSKSGACELTDDYFDRRKPKSVLARVLGYLGL